MPCIVIFPRGQSFTPTLLTFSPLHSAPCSISLISLNLPGNSWNMHQQQVWRWTLNAAMPATNGMNLSCWSVLEHNVTYNTKMMYTLGGREEGGICRVPQSLMNSLCSATHGCNFYTPPWFLLGGQESQWDRTCYSRLQPLFEDLFIHCAHVADNIPLQIISSSRVEIFILFTDVTQKPTEVPGTHKAFNKYLLNWKWIELPWGHAMKPFPRAAGCWADGPSLLSSPSRSQ